MKEAFVRCEVGPDPDDLDASEIFSLEEPIAIRRLQLAIRMVGSTSDNGDLMPGMSPFTCEFADAVGWRVYFWRIVVGEKKDAHPGRC